MKKFVFAILLMSVSAMVMAQTPSLQEGIKHLENENYVAALDVFKKIAQADPKNANIYYYIGEVSYQKEDYAEAEKAYKKGLSVDAQCPLSKVGMGKLLLDQGKATEAQQMFDSAIKGDKKNPEVPALVGTAYMKSKKPDAQKAVQYLIMARDLKPEVASYWVLLGDAYQKMGNSGDAVTSYENAVKKDPKLAMAYISMAKIWTNAKKPDTAIEQLKKAISVDPNNAIAYKDLIELYSQLGKYSEVTPLLEKYVTLAGSDVDAKVRLVKFLTFQAKDYDRAIEEGEKLLKSNPEQYTLHRWLAWSYAEKEMWNESYHHSNELFDAFTKQQDRKVFSSDYEYWAKAAFKLDSLDDAAHIYRKFIELEPTRANEIHGTIAKAYFDKKNYVQAAAYYERKRESKDLSNADEYYLGLAHFYQAIDSVLTEDQSMEQYLKADSAFAKVIAITPDYASAWLMRARVAQNIDSASTGWLAQPYYVKYIELASADPGKNANTIKNLINAHHYMGAYYVQNDDNESAKKEFEAILVLDPANALALEYLEILKQAKGTKGGK